MLVQLLYFPGCPHVEIARKRLEQALGGLEDGPAISDVDVTDARTPTRLRSWGSPTILIDGADVAGGNPSGPSCRIYPDSDHPRSPSLFLIEAALRRCAGKGPRR